MSRNRIRKFLGLLSDLFYVVMLIGVASAWCLFMGRMLWRLFKDLTSY